MGISPSIVRRLVQLALAAAIVMATLAVRVVVSARAELAQADRNRAEGDMEAAVVHYRRAARWYAPASPYHRRALARLMEIARLAEERSDTDEALGAYRAVRSAIMSARSFYTPEGRILEAANQRIAALMASLPPPPIDAGKSHARLQAEHLALLRAETGPNIFWTCVLLLGFVGWVAGAFAFNYRAIDDENRFVPDQARRWGLFIALCFGLFVAGMALA